MDTVGVTSRRDDDWIQELANNAGAEKETEAHGEVIAVESTAKWLTHIRVEMVQAWLLHFLRWPGKQYVILSF